MSKQNSVIIDTSAYSHMLKGVSEIAQVLETYARVYMPITTLAELRAGHKNGTQQNQNEAILEEFIVQPNVFLLYADNTTTHSYASVFFHARKAGKALSNNDLWVAALALQYGHSLLTTDKDFEFLKDKIDIVFVRV